MHVLVPIEILEGEIVPEGLLELLATTNVTILGYHELPEQTPPDQARQQFEERAVAALEDIAAGYTGSGRIWTRLVFTHDTQQTIERVASEVEADAYVLTGAIDRADSLLVALTDDVAAERILGFVEALVGDRDVAVTLFVANKKSEARREFLEASAESLRNAGIDVSTKLVTAKPFDGLLKAVPGHDAIVVGEAAPSLSSFILGDESERIAAASVGPVLVVRRPVETEPIEET